MSILEVKNLEKHFDKTKVLNDISFSLEEGQALSIIGSSGSGKTTLLRCLNFLETPDAGSIAVKGETLFDAADPATRREADVRRKRLHFGLVFQSFNLFPQYTALGNVTLASKLLAKERPDYKQNKKAIFEAIDQEGLELLASMGLSDRTGHYPHQLSGGQQQRVAIARALAMHPDILCFDEPTRAHRRGAAGHTGAGRAQDDDDNRHARDALCQGGLGQYHLYGRRLHRRAGRTGDNR